MTEEKTKFSIIVPVYRVEAYIRQCVGSLLAQTYSNIEIILVDDGSPDDCPNVCDEYAKKDGRIKVIHKENGGVTSARKAGAEQVSGDYVICVDADDYVSADYVEKFAECLTERDYDMICCGYTRDVNGDMSGCPLKQPHGIYERDRIENEIFPSLIKSEDLSYFSYSLGAKAFKRELYLECQKNEDDALKIGEDAVCTMAMIYRTQCIRIIPSCGYFYRLNTASATQQKKAFLWDDPKLEYGYLTKMIDVSMYDFEEQLNRLIVNRLFGVTVSQFYRNEPYSVIKNDIEQHLREPIYAEAIDKAEFSGAWQTTLMMFALRHRCYRLIWLWAKIK